MLGPMPRAVPHNSTACHSLSSVHLRICLAPPPPQFVAHIWEIRTGKRLRTFDGPQEEYAVVSHLLRCMLWSCCCACCGVPRRRVRCGELPAAVHALVLLGVPRRLAAGDAHYAGLCGLSPPSLPLATHPHPASRHPPRLTHLGTAPAHLPTTECPDPAHARPVPQGALARPDRGMRWPVFRWSGGGDAPVLLACMKANAIR